MVAEAEEEAMAQAHALMEAAMLGSLRHIRPVAHARVREVLRQRLRSASGEVPAAKLDSLAWAILDVLMPNPDTVEPWGPTP